MTRLRDFLTLLFPIRETQVLVRDTCEDGVLSHLCPTVLHHGTDEVVALLPYKHRLVSSLISEAKYHHNHTAFRYLGVVLAEYLRAFIEEEDAFMKRSFALVPIPLSYRRKRERGYNQAEEITRAALHALSLPGSPSSHVLERVRNTESQTHLPRAKRLENITGAFVAHYIDPSLSYILIDDVTTTGATFAAAAAALKGAGASRVICVALAH